VVFNNEYIQSFHEAHQLGYGYNRQEAEIEIVNLRLRATGHVTSPEIQPKTFGNTDSSAALIEHSPVIFRPGKSEIPFYDGEKLTPGKTIQGPAIVIRNDTTILIGERDRASVDQYLNLIVYIGY